MFEGITKLLKKLNKKDEGISNSKDAAKERLHLVLMQDRANVSADFLELMKQEIIDVIKKYIDVDEKAIDVRLTNKENSDGTNGAPALYANIPILNIKNEARKVDAIVEENNEEDNKVEETVRKEEVKEEVKEEEKNDKSEDKQDKVEDKVEDKAEKEDESKVEESEEIVKDKDEELEENNEEDNKVEENVETKEEVKSE